MISSHDVHAGPGDVDGLAAGAPGGYDAVLLVSFGGPEGPDDVLAFLRNVTRGRDVPDERLDAVAAHYLHFGGVSPINGNNRSLRAALQVGLARAGHDLPVYWGNRNWEPYLPQVFKDMHAAGHRRVLAVTTSAYSCYSSCRQYREDLGTALVETGLVGRLQVDKVRQYFDHPGFVTPFIEATAAGIAEAQRRLADDHGANAQIHVLFATHSIPVADAHGAGPPEMTWPGGLDAYRAQHLATAQAVLDAIPAAHDVAWSLVFQSRSGPPQIPWLEPDINDAVEELAGRGVHGVVIVPLGFTSDHMEVIWDLDTEAQATCRRLGLVAVRVPTPGTDPRFVAGLVDLVSERLTGRQPGDRLALTDIGPWFDACPAGCCLKGNGSTPAVAGHDTMLAVSESPETQG